MWFQIATYVVLVVALVVLYLCLRLTAHLVKSLDRGFKRIEDVETRMLLREKLHAGPPPVGVEFSKKKQEDLPAFARTVTEGPSGHHFHGSEPQLRTKL